MSDMQDGMVSVPAEVWVAWTRDNLETVYALQKVAVELEDILVRYRQLLKVVLARNGDFDALVEVYRALKETSDVGISADD